MSHIIHAHGAMRKMDPNYTSKEQRLRDDYAAALHIPRPRGKVFTRSVAVCFVLLLVLAVLIATKG